MLGSAESRTDRPSVSVFEALGAEKPDARAVALDALAHQWAERHEWYYREAAESFAFYYGDHYGYWDGVARHWIARPEAPSDVPRLVNNLTAPIVDQGASMLARDLPTFGAVAATSEGEDHASGEAADHILGWGFRFHDLTDLYWLSGRRGFICGTSPVHLQWDMSRGRTVQLGVKIKVPEGVSEGAPEFGGAAAEPGGSEPGAAGEPGAGGLAGASEEALAAAFASGGITVEPVMGPEGDAVFQPLLPEEWIPDPVAKGPQDGLGSFVRQRMSLKTLAEQFPEHDWKREGLSGGTTSDRNMYRNDRISTISPQGGGGAWMDKADTDSVVVHTFYLRNCAKYPLGYMAIFAGGRMLYEGPNPVYPNAELLEVEGGDLWPNHNWPIFVHRHLLRENSPWGLGAVTGVVKLQKAVNGLWSKVVLHAAKVANTKLRVPTGLDQEISDVMGQVIRINRDTPGDAIGYISAPPMDQSYFAALNYAREAIENSMGVNRASAGVSPGDDSSGVAIQALQNQDLGRLVPTKNRLDEQFRQLCAKYLFYWRRYVSTDRQVRIVGANSLTQVRALNRAALSAGIDLELYNRSAIPSTPSARFLALNQMMQSRALDPTNPRDRAVYFDLLGLPDVRDIVQREAGHLKKAKRQNLQIMDGQQVTVSDLDDLAQHRVTLTELYVSEAYESRVAQEKARTNGYSAIEQAFFHKLQQVDALLQARMAQAAPAPSPAGPAPDSGMPPAPGAPPPQFPGVAGPPDGAQTSPVPGAGPPPDGLTMTAADQPMPAPTTGGPGLTMPAEAMAA